MQAQEAAAGDPIPPKYAVIEVHVTELRQLFNAIDPSPFRQKDLDPNAEEFIVGWAREVPGNEPLALVVSLDRSAGLPEEARILREAIREFFKNRDQAKAILDAVPEANLDHDVKSLVAALRHDFSALMGAYLTLEGGRQGARAPVDGTSPPPSIGKRVSPMSSAGSPRSWVPGAPTVRPMLFPERWGAA